MTKLGLYELGPNDTPENGIYQGDCQKLAKAIPDESVDLIVADPPYGIGYVSSCKTRSDGRPRRSRASFGPDELDITWLSEVTRVLKPSGAIYLFTRWDVLPDWKYGLEHVGLTVKQRIIWNKAHWKMGDLRYYGSQTEDILFCIKSRTHELMWPKRSGNLWSSSSAYLPEGQYDHPTQKPESIIRRIIVNSSSVGDIVCDWHCGSGTTAKVARDVGRFYLCFDIAAEFCTLSRERVRNTQPPLFVQQEEQLELMEN